MKRLNITYRLLVLLSCCSVLLLGACDKVDHELDELALTLDPQTPDTAFFGTSFTVKVIANKAREVQVSLASVASPSETVLSETLTNAHNSFIYELPVEVPADSSWDGSYVLRVLTVGQNGEKVEKSSNIFFMPSPIQDYYLVGGSSDAGWEPSKGIKFMRYTKEDKGVVTEWYDIFGYFTVAGDGLKILPTTKGWDGDMGAAKGEQGKLTDTDEDNITVPADGFYRLRINPKDGTYSLVESNWGVIGDATPGGWDTDTDMTLVDAGKGKYVWTATINLEAGKAFKFRENDSWDINLGLDGAGPRLKYDGANIAVGAGKQYVIKLNLSPSGYTYTIE